MGLIPIAILLSARETKPSPNSNAYLHGTMTCLEGIEGPGSRIELRQEKICDGYPYLEIDIRERPIPVHKRIVIGPDNWAFKCPNLKESCEQSLSGEVVFDRFESKPGKAAEMDGHYELRFRSGSEAGRFKVDCFRPCA